MNQKSEVFKAVCVTCMYINMIMKGNILYAQLGTCTLALKLMGHLYTLHSEMVHIQILQNQPGPLFLCVIGTFVVFVSVVEKFVSCCGCS